MPDFAALGIGEDAGTAGGEWVLAPIQGEPYPHTATLGDCGVSDGSVLVLRSLRDTGAVPPSPPRGQPTDSPRSTTLAR